MSKLDLKFLRGADINSIPFVDSTGKLFTSSTFVFNGTNLGIGTATPSAKLEVAAGTSGTTFLANGVGLTNTLTVNDPAAIAGELGVKKNFVIGFNNGATNDTSWANTIFNRAVDFRNGTPSSANGSIELDEGKVLGENSSGVRYFLGSNPTTTRFGNTSAHSLTFITSNIDVATMDTSGN